MLINFSTTLVEMRNFYCRCCNVILKGAEFVEHLNWNEHQLLNKNAVLQFLESFVELDQQGDQNDLHRLFGTKQTFHDEKEIGKIVMEDQPVEVLTQRLTPDVEDVKFFESFVHQDQPGDQNNLHRLFGNKQSVDDKKELVKFAIENQPAGVLTGRISPDVQKVKVEVIEDQPNQIKPTTINPHQNINDEKTPLREKSKASCRVCKQTFNSSSYRNCHEKKVHDNQGFECSACGKVYVTKSHLREHISMAHSNIPGFLCTECGRRFAKKYNLKSHMGRHLGVKFTCSVCPKQFACKYSLKTHMSTHTGEKKYACEICNRAFSRSDRLTVHKRVHTGEKPYKCQYCDSSFSQCNTLAEHMRRHTGERYTCDVCPKYYYTLSRLRKHKRQH